MQIETFTDFTIRTAHILTCEHLNDTEKLNCIRLIYREFAFPECVRSQSEDELLHKIK